MSQKIKRADDPPLTKSVVPPFDRKKYVEDDNTRLHLERYRDYYFPQHEPRISLADFF